MEENQAIAYIVLGLLTVGSLFGSFLKFTKPINDLNMNIIKLNATIETLLKNEEIQNKRLDKHGEEIDELKSLVAIHEEKFKNFEGK